MKHLRRSLAVLASVSALVLSGLLPGTTPDAQAADICTMDVVSLRRDNGLTGQSFQGNKLVASYRSTDTLPLVPRSMATFNDGYLNDTEPFGSSGYLVLTTSGDIYQMLLAWDHSAKTIRYNGSMLLNTSFDGFREIAYSEPYIYGLHTNGGLYRYTHGQYYEPLRGQLVSMGWGGVRDLRDMPRERSDGDRSVNTLMAVVSRTGELVKYVIPQDAPTQWRRVQMGSHGWASMATVVPYDCQVGGTIAISRSTRDAFLYNDPTPLDSRSTVTLVRQVASRWYDTPMTSG